MHVDVVSPEELDAVHWGRWRQIQDQRRALDSPFLAPEFVRAVGRVRPDVRIAVMTDDERATGFLPYHRRSHGRGAALALGLSDVQGLVVPRAFDLDLGAVMRACGLRSLVFDHLLAEQESLVASLPSRVTVAESPVVDIAAGLDEYWTRCRAGSKSLLQSTARKRRKLERDHGPVTLTFHEPSHATLDVVLGWKSEQYRRTGRRDRFADPSTRRLVHDLLEEQHPNFGAPLTVLRAGEAIVAAHFGLRSGGTLAWWFPVYDPAFAAYSPGLVFCVEIIGAMAEEQLSLLDLGKGDEPYKERLSNGRIRLLQGSVATHRTVQAARTTLRWPQERAMQLVLGSPRLREVARKSLAGVGEVRSRLAR